ncbi:MAG: SAM-dependent chlorinase/fluorinase [Candidatus Aureabacteria bacterium]|nr:SAM-dependent chlorinase/fluorinase [Candidatus Auribacterota bacterium]
MKPRGFVTLITDFGLGDWYAGTLNGAILSIAPHACIIEVTHSIPRGDVIGAAIALRSSYRYFPAGTVHMIVVDPGVGSARKILYAERDGHRFIAPDNGILPLALGTGAMKGSRFLENAKLWRERVSHTFHGRDIMAPVVAHLLNGVSPARLGPTCRNFVTRSFPRPRDFSARSAAGEVLYVDAFGNLITNIEEDSPITKGGGEITVRIRGKGIKGVSSSYESVPRGELLAIWGSSGFLEIAINGGSAAKRLRAGRGSGVDLERMRSRGKENERR